MKIRKSDRNISVVLGLILISQALVLPFLSIHITASPPIDEPKGPPYVINVYPVPSVITIDGNLSEPAWSNPNTANVTTTLTLYDWNITILAFHNTTHLFVGINAFNDSTPHPNDFCELAFDVDHDEVSPPEVEDFQIRAESTDPSISNETEISNGTGAGWSLYADETDNPNTWPAGYEANASVWGNAQYEFQIPIEKVWGQASPADGNITGFIVHTKDMAAFAHVWWPDNSDDNNNPTIEYCDDASNYGDLIFHSSGLGNVTKTLYLRKDGLNVATDNLDVLNTTPPDTDPATPPDYDGDGQDGITLLRGGSYLVDNQHQEWVLVPEFARPFHILGDVNISIWTIGQGGGGDNRQIPLVYT